MSDDTKKKIENFSQSRRNFLKMARTAGYTAPVVATFSMSGLMSRAQAHSHSNMS